MPRNVSNLNSKENKLDVNKLVPAPVDLGKLNDDVKIDGVRKKIYTILKMKYLILLSWILILQLMLK